MNRMHDRFALRIAALAACLALSGCAVFGPPGLSPEGRGTVHTPAGNTLTPQAAMDTLAIGSSTKAEVAAALGPAIVIPFDSGYEVWAYRWPGADRSTRAATELVLLFDPAGRLAKARIRPGDTAGSR
jgi:outer membrane protein assembly factor BamE (lipoprotein component of BamABCDE complex)